MNSVRLIILITKVLVSRFNRCKLFAVVLQSAVLREQIDNVAMATRTPLSIGSIFYIPRQERLMTLERCS